MTSVPAIRRPSGPLHLPALLLMAMLVAGNVVTAPGAMAQTPIHCAIAAPADTAPGDPEPNGTPEEAPVVDGELCIEGTMPDGDQDLLVWTTSASGRPWTITIDGVPGTLTIVQLIPITSEPGVTPIAAGSKLIELGSPVDATGPVEFADLLVPPGRYVIGIGRSATPDGATPTTEAYRVSIVPGAPLPPSGDIEPNADEATASPVRGAFSISGDLQTDSDLYAWTIDESDAGRTWLLRVQSELRTPLDLALVAPDRTSLAATFAITGLLELPDLALPAGTYILRLGQSADQPRPYRIDAIERPEEGVDREPNDDRDTAQPLDPADPFARGRLARESDRDHFALTVDEAMASNLIDVRLISRTALRRQVCISDAEANPLQCRGGTGPIVLGNLVLPTGTYDIEVSGEVVPWARYLLRVDSTSEPAAGFEREPNDIAAFATPLDPSIPLRGTSIMGDDDVFRIVTTGEPQLWDIRATGTGIKGIGLIRADDTPLAQGAVAPDGTAAALPDLYLEPGSHWVSLRGGGGDYAVELVPQGPPDITAEREPNDQPLLAEPIGVGETRTGRIRTATDVDVLRFSTAAEEHLVLHLEPPADGAVDVRLTSGTTRLLDRPAGAVGEPLAIDTLLPAGDYELELSAGTASDLPYRVTIERADPFVVADDQEPNDSESMARPMPASMAASGIGAGPEDEDWYLLPAQPEGTQVVVRLDGQGGRIGLSADGRTIYAQPGPADEPGVVRADVPADLPVYLGVTADGPYRFAVEAGVPTTEAPVAAPPLPPTDPVAPGSKLSLALELATDTVAAYWDAGQVVTGTLVVTNTGATPATVSLDTVTSHYAWTPVLGESTLEVPAGGQAEVAVRLDIAPDAWADVPVRVTVRARDGIGAQVTGFAEVTPGRDMPPVDPTQVWSVPDALLGGLDVASLGLGAEVIRASDQEMEAQLHDGVAPAGGGFATYVELPQDLTVDLAGEEPVLVAGIILDPQAGAGKLDDQLRAFELLLSEDGQEFEVALRGELSPLPIEQAFVLPTPMPARFAQLRMITSWGVPGDRIDLGEWQVIAAPGETPLPGPLNVADPALGGHVVVMQPQSDDPEADVELLSEDRVPQTVAAEGGGPRVVIGFQDGRAAAITELQWVDPSGSSAADRATEATVEVSTSGPTGPWTELSTWTLTRAADGSVAPLVLAEPTWARYVRLTLTGADRKATDRELPATIRVLERPMDDAYRSIVGAWGSGSAAGPLEWVLPPDVAEAPEAPDTDPVGLIAEPLLADLVVHGRVTRGVDTDRYRLTVPVDQNELTLTLGGDPFVGTRLVLLDATGYPVETRFGPGVEPGTVAYTATVEPGVSYDVVVDQPPASVVFAFDTSPSIDTYLSSVLEALRAFAADVTPGEEAVQVLPFEGRPLLPKWADEPFLVRDAIRSYVSDSRSSNAEIALLDGIDLLSTREGARAILLVTDAETGSHGRNVELWSALAASRPLVFPVHIGGYDTPVLARHLMQDWAASAGGVYQYARSNGQMDRAFDRLATWLRRPPTYTLGFATTFVEEPPPKPGTITVSGPKASIGAGTPIEIVFDTSGSMLQKIKGKRRIDIARAALIDLVQERIPAGTPVALRVFEPGADDCGTKLEVPMSPLDPVAMADTIGGLKVIQATDTPIGAALDAVADDLAGITGPKSVILVTDGEETCGGDPRRAIRRLSRDLGAQVNIVGFALSQKKVKRQMQTWARDGRGLYYDAPDAKKLVKALSRALGAPFRVYDPSGNQVAGGTVNGGAVSLPPGSYTVEVLVEPVVRFARVEVDEGGAVKLRLP